MDTPSIGLSFDFSALAAPAVYLALGAGLLLATARDWRLTIAALGLQYAAVFVLTAQDWPLSMALVKLVAGWMSAAMLAMAMPNAGAAGGEADIVSPLPGEILAGSIGATLFRLLAGAMAAITAFSFAPAAVAWLPEASLEQARGALILVTAGLLLLGVTRQPFRAVVGLLSALAGFEILYAAVESSTLVAGLLAAVNLSLGMVGAYLVTAREEAAGG
ncbi:MAG: hypothetical protein L0Z70_01150 [Chloroflexi bacterium]|nr:hypothetical protein [Chloroflexota bacterium]